MATTFDMSQYQLAQSRQQQAQLAAKQQNAQTKSKGIGIVMFLCILLFTVFLDLVDFFTAGTIGTLIGIIGDGILLIVTGISKAGKKQFKKILVMTLGEAIPVVSILPLRTIMWTWSFLASHPEWFVRLGKALKVAGTVASVASKIPTPLSPELAAAGRIAKNTGNAATQVGEYMQNSQAPDQMKRAIGMRKALKAAREMSS